MSAEPLEPALSEAEYAAIEATLRGSGRGRLFLAEHAHRARAGELAALLGAVERIRERARFAEGTQGIAAPTLARISQIVRETQGLVEPSDQDAPSSLPVLTEAAERLQDLTWTLREQGTEPSLCDTLERHARDIIEVCAQCEAESNAIARGAAAFRAVAEAISDHHGTTGEDPGAEGQETDGERSPSDGTTAAADHPADLAALTRSVTEAFAAIDALSTREKLALIS